MRGPCVHAACCPGCAGIGAADGRCHRPCMPIAAAARGRLVTVKRSLDSENACVLRVRCAAGDDIGISSITLIYAEIVMPNAQTRQDAARSHFYAGEFGRTVPVWECAVRAWRAGPGARAVAASTQAESRPAAARSTQWLRTQRMSHDDAARSASRCDGRRHLARLCDRRDAIEGALL